MSLNQMDGLLLARSAQAMVTLEVLFGTEADHPNNTSLRETALGKTCDDG